MKNSTQASIKNPGIYLFSREKTIQASIRDSLLVTFHSPSSTSTGIVIQGNLEHRRDFLDKLETLFEKYKNLPDVDGALIRCKVFGRAEKNGPLLLTLKNWLQRHHLPVVASDLSRALPGEVAIDCANGKVGVQYLHRTENLAAYFLSTGTARDRSPQQKPAFNILVLTEIASSRILIKQTIEELNDCSASCPLLTKNGISSELMASEWSAIVITDELKNNLPVLRQVANLQEKNPELPVRWVGAFLPKLDSITNLKLVPPLEPVLIPHFKKMLQQALADSDFSKTSETFKFSGRKAKR